MNKLLFSLLFIIFFTVFVGTASASSFIPLGDFPGGDFFSVATAVSGDGAVVVGGSEATEPAAFGGTLGYRWTLEDGMQIIQDPINCGFSFARDVSADGKTIVGEVEPSVISLAEAFKWSNNDGLELLGDLTGGPFISTAGGVSTDGTTIAGVGFSDTPNGEGVIWTEDGIMSIGSLGGPGSTGIRGISGDGTIVVGDSFGSNGREMIRWTQEDGMVGLGDLPGGDFFSLAWAVSQDGSVIVGVGTTGEGTEREAVMWTESDGLVGLGDLPGGTFNSAAFGVSPDGSIIVGRGFTEEGSRAMIWDEVNGMRDLNTIAAENGIELGDYVLKSAEDISDDGNIIVGNAQGPLGFEAYRINFGDSEPTAPPFLIPIMNQIPMSGDFIVTDQLNRLLGVSPNGEVLVIACNVGNAFGVVIDSEENFIVTDSSGINGHLFRVTPDGIVSEIVSGLGNVRGIALDMNGDYIVIEGQGKDLLRITPEGVITTIASSGLGDPVYVEIDPQGDFIVTSQTGSLLRVTPEGVVSVIDLFVQPQGIAIDSSGNFIVTDRVQGGGSIFKDGVLIADNLGKVRDIAIDSNGDYIVAIASDFDGRLLRVTPDGIVTEIANGLRAPAGVAVMSSQKLSQQVVGGEFIPIETTSLLLASAQSFSWMIPVVLSVLGIGLFVLRRSDNS